MGAQITEITTDIILIDVVGYSLLNNEKQLKTAKVIGSHISTLAPLLSEFSGLKKEDVLLGFIPTGDGLYIILNPKLCGYGILLALSVRNHLVWTAMEFLKDLYKGVRVAVTMGKALPYQDINNITNYAGDGLNDCARLLSNKQVLGYEKTINEMASELCGDDNYAIASEIAYYWFRQLFKEGVADNFLSMIKFRKSDQFQIMDKHDKVHTFYFIEASRHVVIQPPNPRRLSSKTDT